MKHKVYVSPGYRIPLLISCLGFVLCILCIFWTEDMNILVFSAYAVLSAGTIWFLKVWVDEQYRLGREIRFPLKLIFPAYPLVADFDQNTSKMSAFREAYADFMGSDRRPVSNSRLQHYATQLLWPSVDLQKRRMDRLGVQMDMEANRRSYVKGSKGVMVDAYFDGRYEVEEVSEEIYALRTFRSRSRLLKRLYDKEVAHYTFLSAQEVGEDQFVCTNCGSLSSRSDLLDGCDFCKTTFTIEDLEHRVGSFGFRRDFQASEGKRKAMKKLIYPWIYMLTIVPWMYVGLFMPLYISDMNLFERIAGSLLCALTFAIGAFAVVTFALFLIFPLVMMFTKLWGGFNRWLLYRSPEEVEQERQMASYVRSFDPLFSLQSFLGGVQNKLYALYFADRTKQVNAFSDIDLASLLPPQPGCCRAGCADDAHGILRKKRGCPACHSQRRNPCTRIQRYENQNSQRKSQYAAGEKRRLSDPGGLRPFYSALPGLWQQPLADGWQDLPLLRPRAESEGTRLGDHSVYS